jgi:hypothetical protein
MNKANPVRTLAWSLAILALALSAAGLVIGLLAPDPGRVLLRAHVLFIPLTAVTFALMGALVASRRPGNPIGWIMSAVGVLAGLTLLAVTYKTTGQSGTVSLPGVTIARWLDLWIWLPFNVLPLTFLPLLFPDGHLPSPRWRPVAWAAALSMVAYCLGTALHPAAGRARSALNRLASPARPARGSTVECRGRAASAGALGSLAALIVRLRRAQGGEREQLKWLVYADLVAMVVVTLTSVWYAIQMGDPLAYELTLTSSLGTLNMIALATSIAILRYRLYDIDLVINRTLVYGALTAAVIAIYVLAVGALGVALQASGSLAVSLLGVGLVAIVAQPCDAWRAVATDVPERDDPTPCSRSGARLGPWPRAVLLRRRDRGAGAQAALRRHGAGAEFGRDRPGEGLPDCRGLWIAPGRRVAPAAGLPGRNLGNLAGWSAPWRELLRDGPALARRPGAPGRRGRARRAPGGRSAALARAVGDGARRRAPPAAPRPARRVGLAARRPASARRHAAHAAPAGLPAAAAGVAELQAEIHAAIADIRRLVYDLRPPALDELGLAGALRSLAAQCSAAHGANGLQVWVDAPEQLPPLPAAVEVAGYRIAQEALTNVVRHAHAHSCRVRVTLGDDLRLDVQDDGIGLTPAATPV